MNLHLMMLLALTGDLALPSNKDEPPVGQRRPADPAKEAELLSFIPVGYRGNESSDYYRTLQRRGNRYLKEIESYLRTHEVSEESHVQLKARQMDLEAAIGHWDTLRATAENLEWAKRREHNKWLQEHEQRRREEARRQEEEERARRQQAEQPPIPPDGTLSVTCPVRLCQAPPGYQCRTHLWNVSLAEATWELIKRRSRPSSIAHPTRVREAKKKAQKRKEKLPAAGAAS